MFQYGEKGQISMKLYFHIKSYPRDGIIERAARCFFGPPPLANSSTAKMSSQHIMDLLVIPPVYISKAPSQS